MLSKLTWPLLLTLSVLVLNAPAFGSKPTPEAQALIETLGLSEADAPISKHPGWKPRKIVVMLLPKAGFGSPDYEAQLRNAAGEVELVIDHLPY